MKKYNREDFEINKVSGFGFMVENIEADKWLNRDLVLSNDMADDIDIVYYESEDEAEIVIEKFLSSVYLEEIKEK